MYMCPVCGYDGLRRPPSNFLICPSCGTEFGYSDSVADHAQLQTNWLLDGGRWHSTVIRPPAGWSAREQVQRLNNLIHTDTLNVSSDVHFSGTVVPPERARASSVRIVFFGRESDLTGYAPPAYA